MPTNTNNKNNTLNINAELNQPSKVSDLSQLSKLSLSELKEQWLLVYKSKPPVQASRSFLLGHLVYQLQSKQVGGLSKSTQRQIKQLITQLKAGKEVIATPSVTIKSGTRLLRQYQGETHEVIAQDKGFLYREQSYRSLSAIARKITGTQWNGKLFFGIKA